MSSTPKGGCTLYSGNIDRTRTYAFKPVSFCMRLAFLALSLALIYVVCWPWGLVFKFDALYIRREGLSLHYWSIVVDIRWSKEVSSIWPPRWAYCTHNHSTQPSYTHSPINSFIPSFIHLLITGITSPRIITSSFTIAHSHTRTPWLLINFSTHLYIWRARQGGPYNSFTQFLLSMTTGSLAGPPAG